MKNESIEALLIMINSDESASKFNDVTEYREHLKKFIKFCDLVDLANDTKANEATAILPHVVGSAFVEVPKPYIEDAEAIEINGGIYIVEGRVSKCYISKEDIADVMHIAN